MSIERKEMIPQRYIGDHQESSIGKKEIIYADYD